MFQKVNALSRCIFILAFVIIISASSYPASAKTSTLITKINATSKLMCLTFDAGSDSGNTSKILEILSKYNVKSTFFLTGEFAASNPKLTKEILKQGHEIGNHSYSHPDFTTLSASSMKSEIDKTSNKITAVTGQNPQSLFRPPYGAYNSSVLKAVGDLGYNWTVYWTIDTLDWEGIEAEDITKKVLKKASPGGIVLMHVGGGAVNTPEALPEIIEGLQSEGYKLVTISQALSDTSSLGTSNNKTYTVKSGDTLCKIASMYGVTVKSLVAANNILNPDIINIGQVLIIPVKGSIPASNTSIEQTLYTVKPGDTLWRISKLYSVDIKELIKVNNISNPSLIHPGQVLIIPNK